MMFELKYDQHTSSVRVFGYFSAGKTRSVLYINLHVRYYQNCLRFCYETKIFYVFFHTDDFQGFMQMVFIKSKSVVQRRILYIFLAIFARQYCLVFNHATCSRVESDSVGYCCLANFFCRYFFYWLITFFSLLKFCSIYVKCIIHLSI